MQSPNFPTTASVVPTTRTVSTQQAPPNPAEKPWMKFAGIAANDPEMVAELMRLERIGEENFEQIEEEEWK